MTPNILFILTDQQHARMMGCAGHPTVRTPHLDALAAEGTRFELAYCANPVCIPSRFSLFTGRPASAIGLRGNTVPEMPGPVPEEILQQGLGWRMRAAGWRAAFAGKQHFPRYRAEDLGFEVLTKDERDGGAAACAEFLRTEHDRPFLLVASLINPHDICYHAIRAFGDSPFERMLLEKGQVELAELDRALARPEGMTEEEWVEREAPPLPPNFEPPADEPEAIVESLRARSFRWGARQHWTAHDWRRHRLAYARLTERVDGQVGVILGALRASGRDRDTLVIFTSDHGDHDASRRMEHKDTCYDEAARVPLLIRRPGGEGGGGIDTTTLVNNGLDLVPTCCDLAGVAPPPGLPGRSLAAVIEHGPAAPGWSREAIVTECSLARMVRTRRWKYVLHHCGAHAEQLFDMDADPWERTNLAADPTHAAACSALRHLLRGWCEAVGDRIGAAYVHA